jgi:hypothetical protein
LADLDLPSADRYSAEASLKRPKRPSPVVAREYTNVVADPTEEFRHAGHGALAYLIVQVAQVQDREAVESHRQPR